MERYEKIKNFVESKEYYNTLRKIDIIDLHNDICTLCNYAEDFIRERMFDLDSFLEGYSDDEIKLMTEHEMFRQDRYFWYDAGILVCNDFIVYDKARETIDYYASMYPDDFYDMLVNQYDFPEMYDDDE